ncbi:hypothetical protein RDSD_001351 [Oleidesulfovibrio alaskensis]|jgi:hypothetical protein
METRDTGTGNDNGHAVKLLHKAGSQKKPDTADGQQTGSRRAADGQQTGSTKKEKAPPAGKSGWADGAGEVSGLPGKGGGAEYSGQEGVTENFLSGIHGGEHCEGGHPPCVKSYLHFCRIV